VFLFPWEKPVLDTVLEEPVVEFLRDSDSRCWLTLLLRFVLSCMLETLLIEALEFGFLRQLLG
jgi:hypothetical protein